MNLGFALSAALALVPKEGAKRKRTTTIAPVFLVRSTGGFHATIDILHLHKRLLQDLHPCDKIQDKQEGALKEIEKQGKCIIQESIYML